MSASINDRIGQRLGRNILTQALVIGFASIVGVWVAALTLEHVLIKAALKKKLRITGACSKDGRRRTRYSEFDRLSRCRAQLAEHPADLRELPVGYSLESEQDVKVVYVDDLAKRLVLVFEVRGLGPSWWPGPARTHSDGGVWRLGGRPGRQTRGLTD